LRGVGDDFRSRLQSRGGRAIIWLTGAATIHVSAGAATFVLAGITVATSDGGAAAWAFAAFFVAFFSSAGLIRAELRDSSRGRPAQWPRRAFGAASPQAVALCVAASAHLAQPVLPLLIAGAVAVATLQIAAANMASRSIQLPYSADLGELNVEITAKVRRGRSPEVPFLSSNEVTLTAKQLRFSVQPDLSWKFEHEIVLASIARVDVRDVDKTDGPWCVLADGRECPTPPGEALVVQSIHGSKQILPIFNPREFAEILRVRVRRARADARLSETAIKREPRFKSESIRPSPGSS
jgi:hypothetical protein